MSRQRVHTSVTQSVNCWAAPSCGAQIAGEAEQVRGTTLGNLTPQSGAVRVGHGGVPQGHEDRGQPLLNDRDGARVGRELASGRGNPGHLANEVALPCRDGVTTPRTTTSPHPHGCTEAALGVVQCERQPRVQMHASQR